MNLLHAVGRGLTGVPYIKLGFDAATTPGMRVDAAAPLLDRLPLPVDNETVVRANGAAQAFGGALIAAGIAPRAAAGLVLASLVPTTIAGHGFWTYDDPAARAQQKVQFLKNVAMAGGLVTIIAAGRK
ncbi:DoxX family membrane protein [Gordonia sp. PDNC005]|uniref:DoxX family membrane protein n=1 Tax=unclassified Gordonia (in: high G+C Gram-positive bacteria) TaxID=2657482 RepID=UPI001962530C|nr:DoxX family membrane protein [Gordonia sp. PDNC005]QRY62410.1 DoxX family membrane protein [Gordonia sp. PDNC005]